MGVDAAWSYTTGHPAVVLAWLDDGFDFQEIEVIRNLALNPGELRDNPPLRFDGSSCAPLSAGDPNSPRLDCSEPPDGRVTVDDYVEYLARSGSVAEFDTNDNGLLDPVDLIHLFSNGTDDDGNGFIDDICGWDFVDDDNIPADARGTGHGTAIALDALAAANDGRGRAGVCPDCTGLPLRVGDQRGLDPQRTALALLYASQRGATAALVGHSVSGATEILDATLELVSSRGLLVLTGTAGEGAEHIEPWALSDRVLEVGAVTLLSPDQDSTSATSFLVQDPCQSHGASPTVLAAAPPCSDRGPGIALGIAGLAASANRLGATSTGLTTGELQASISAAAANGSASWSLAASTDGSFSPPEIHEPPTGRIDAAFLVASVKGGSVPPEIELARPYWFEPVVGDNLAAPLAVIGTVSARRAIRYDLTVDAAVGRHPEETGFRTISEFRDVPGPQVLGGDGAPLATLDLRSWLASAYPELEPQQTAATELTLRLRAVAHYGESISARSAVTYRVLTLLTDPDLLPGFPIRVGATPTSPRLTDLDRDGNQEVVVATSGGRVLALKVGDSVARDVPGWPYVTDRMALFADGPSGHGSAPIFGGVSGVSPSLGRGAIPAAPAIGDVDDDGVTELAFATSDGVLHLIASTGVPKPGWPVQLPAAPECAAAAPDTTCPRLERGTSSSSVLADVDGDKSLEVLLAAHDGQVHAYRSDGTVAPGWPIRIDAGPDTTTGPLTRSPAVADTDGDGCADLVVTAGETRSRDFDLGTHTLILGGPAPDGPRVAPGWPVTVSSYDPLVGLRDRATPPAAIERSSLETARIYLYGNASMPYRVPTDPGSQTDPTEPPSRAEPRASSLVALGFDLVAFGADSPLSPTDAIAPLLARPVLADLDRDGFRDLVLPSLLLATVQGLHRLGASTPVSQWTVWNGRTGQMLPGAPIPLSGLVYASPPVVADITGDGYPEVIGGDGTGHVTAIDACGRIASGWPKQTAAPVSASAAIGDINGDGNLEVVAASSDGWLYAWRTAAPVDEAYVGWASELSDNANSSSTPAVAESKELQSVQPLAIDSQGRCVDLTDPDKEPSTESVLSARGGCSCNLHRSSPPSGTVSLLGVLLLPLCRRPRVRRDHPSGPSQRNRGTAGSRSAGSRASPNH